MPLKGIMAGILIGGLLFTLTGGFAFGGEPTDNLIQFHRDLKTVKSDMCVTCHGEKGEDKSLNANYPAAHALHRGKLKMECNACHKSADLEEGSGAAMRKQVSSNICLSCHNGKRARALFLVTK